MEKKIEAYEEQDENKNQILTSETDERKKEIIELQKKLDSLTKSVEEKKRLLEVKDEENRNYFQKIKN